jgi:hypothetical protein
MIPFFTCREEDENGKLQYYILQKAFPHYVGLLSEIPIKFKISTPITAHNLWVVFDGSIRGNFIPSYRGVEDEIAMVINDMSLWFYENRILKEPKKYKKWHLPPQSTT